MRTIHEVSFAGSLLVLAIMASFLVVAPSSRAQEGLEDDPFEGVEQMVVLGLSSAALLGSLSGNSVVAFDGETLEALGVDSIDDIAKFTPNLEIVSPGSTAATLFIRGVGLNDFSATSGGAIAVFQDGVPILSPSLQLGQLFDIEGVAVLRGPQGTGPNRNASGGAIKSISRRPSGELGATFKIGVGNFNGLEAEAALDVPIFPDLLSARLSFRGSRRDGFFENRCGGAPIPDPANVFTGPGAMTANAPFSHCGENVPRFNRSVPGSGFSEVEPGLPKTVGDQGGWAARAVILFTPDFEDFEAQFLLNVHGGQIDQDSPVGAQIGTQGILLDETGTQFLQFGRLGGLDGEGYRDPDIATRATAMRSAIRAGLPCQPTCTANEIRAGFSVADRRLAEELVSLDSNPYIGNFNRPGDTTLDTFGASLTGSFDFEGGYSLESISAIDQYERYTFLDIDFSPNSLAEIQTEDSNWQATQLLKLTGGSDDEYVHWALGGYYIRERVTVEVTAFQDDLAFFANAIPTFRDYSQVTQSAAAYGELSWEFLEYFTLDGGVRFNWEKKEMDYNLTLPGGRSLAQTPAETWTAPTGTIRLTHQFLEESEWYMKYNRGWKSGNFNATGNIDQGVGLAKPEDIDAFEVGFLTSHFEGRLSLSGSLFYYAYQDYQLFTSTNGFGSPPQFVIINASDVQVLGAELDAAVRPWEGSLFEVRFGWLESKFSDFIENRIIQGGGGVPGQQASPTFDISQDHTGNRLLNSPRFTVNLTVQQEFDLGAKVGTFIARWDGAWKDDTFFDATEGRGFPLASLPDTLILPEGTLAQEAFWLHNLRFTYREPTEVLELSAWVQNLTDETIKVFSIDASAFLNSTLYFLGDRRTYGASVRMTF